jgi:hypothetical protein
MVELYMGSYVQYCTSKVLKYEVVTRGRVSIVETRMMSTAASRHKIHAHQFEFYCVAMLRKAWNTAYAFART